MNYGTYSSYIGVLLGCITTKEDVAADTARTKRPLSLSLSPCSFSPFRSGHRDRTSRTDEAQASGARCSVLRARPRLISQSKPKNSVVKRTRALNRALHTYGRSVGAREFANRGCVGVEGERGVGCNHYRFWDVNQG